MTINSLLDRLPHAFVAAISTMVVFPVLVVLAVVAWDMPAARPAAYDRPLLLLLALSVLSGVALLPIRTLRLPWAAIAGPLVAVAIFSVLSLVYNQLGLW